MAVRETILGVGPHAEGATMVIMMLAGMAIGAGFLWMGFKALDIAERIDKKREDRASFDVKRRKRGEDD